MEEANKIAQEIADNTSPVSVALTRQMLWKLLGADHPMEAHKIDSRSSNSEVSLEMIFQSIPIF